MRAPRAHAARRQPPEQWRHRVRLPLLRAARRRAQDRGAQECGDVAHSGRAAANLSAAGFTARALPRHRRWRRRRRWRWPPSGSRELGERDGEHGDGGRGRHFREVPPAHRPAERRSEKALEH